MTTTHAPIIATPESIARVVKMVRTRSTTTQTAMKSARETMQDETLALGAAVALTNLQTEWDALDAEKKKASNLKSAIRAVYKDMSTAVSHERAILKREVNDETIEIAKLHATFPFRIKSLKGCFVVLSAAEFDAETANRRTTTPAPSPVTDVTDDTAAPGLDKAASAIRALELALADMTRSRDTWMARAETAERALAAAKTARKPVAASKKAPKVAKAA